MKDYLINKIFKCENKCNNCVYFISHYDERYSTLNITVSPNCGLCNKEKGYYEVRFNNENICFHFKRKKEI